MSAAKHSVAVLIELVRRLPIVQKRSDPHTPSSVHLNKRLEQNYVRSERDFLLASAL